MTQNISANKLPACFKPNKSMYYFCVIYCIDKKCNIDCKFKEETKVIEI